MKKLNMLLLQKLLKDIETLDKERNQALAALKEMLG